VIDMMTDAGLELDQIQGNIFPGFFKDAQDFLFVSFPSRQAGETWLTSLPAKLSPARRVNEENAAWLAEKDRLKKEAPPGVEAKSPPPTAPSWASVAISATGLSKLGVDPSGLEKEFNYSPADRAEHLGDSDVFGTFEVGGKTTEADALLIVGTNNDDEMKTYLETTFRLDAASGKVGEVDLLAHFRGRSLGKRREHFGFIDSLSQPVPGALSKALADDDKWDPDPSYVAPGEFILGAKNEEGKSTLSGPEWARSGSYLTFRKMRQSIPEWTAALSHVTDELAAHNLTADEDIVAAKLLGRARGSEAVVDFANDADGKGCPLFAHIRKANPREESEAESRQHRIIRRGIPYGPKFEPGDPPDAANVDRGMLFVAYQASIARGFEFVQTRWLGTNLFPHPGANGGPELSVLRAPGADPFTGWDVSGNRTVLYHKGTTGSEWDDFVRVTVPRFVHVTGSGYFFAPAIGRIADMLNSRQGSTL